MTNLIYEPRGRAREYAALACNIYRGCGHGCVYCYAPLATRRKRDVFELAERRFDLTGNLINDAEEAYHGGKRGQVLLCFTTDAYQPLAEQCTDTRQAIEILHRFGFSVCVLTKGGARALRDLDVFTPQDAFAATMTCLSEKMSLEWEPGAALPSGRIEAIRKFHNAGIPTWVSLEPVLDPNVSLNIIYQTCEWVDGFKVGKLNYHPLAKTIDWGAFGHAAIELLEKLGYRNDPEAKHWYYIKDDLVKYL